MIDEDVKNALERLKTLQDEKNKVPETYLTLNHYQLEKVEKIINENYISKDKIREKIKDLENKRDEEILSITSALFQRDINLLQELLGDEQ